MENITVEVTQAMLDRMEEKISQIRPQLLKIKETYGSLSYFEYVRQKNRTNPNKSFRDRKPEVIAVIKEETARLLGTKIANEVERQLKKNDSVSTAEHSAPIGTPHSLSAGLHVAVPLFGNSDPRLQNLIILSCSGISFNNNLSFSRGFQFHTAKDGNVIDNQITFFGRSVDPELVLYADPYTEESVEEVKKNLGQNTNLSSQEKEKITHLLDTVYLSPHSLTGKDYVDQLTISNFYLWRELFPTFKADQIPNYIMLSQEKILLQLLRKYHLHADTPIHRFLFEPSYINLIEKYFADTTGAFAKDYSFGTFLFWGISDHNRFQLRRVDNMLTNKDGSYQLPLEPNAVEQAILRKEIYPSLLLTFIVFSFYYGLLLGGGASQTTYLTQMKEGYIAMMKELNDMESAHDSEESTTDDFVFYRPHLAFLDTIGERLSATGMDMYLYQDPKNWKSIIEATKTISIAEFITILLPILYKQFCPEDQREEELMNINRQDVEKFIGFDKKLPILGVIPEMASAS